MSQPPDDQLKALWQGQETEIEPMSVDAIRARASADRDKGLRNYATAILIAVFCGAFFAWRASVAPNATFRLGCFVEIAWVPWAVWRMGRRWPAMLPGASASAEQLLDFHRSQIVRRQQTFGEVMLVGAPLFVAVAIQVVGLWPPASVPWLRAMARFAPILALIVLWIIALVLLHRRQQRKLQAQIDELDRLTR